MRAIVESVIKSVKKNESGTNRGSKPYNVSGVWHTKRVFNMACVGTRECNHTVFQSRPVLNKIWVHNKDDDEEEPEEDKEEQDQQPVDLYYLYIIYIYI